MKLLVVEDEHELRKSLVEGLQLCGYYMDSCEDGETADAMACSGEYDLIILDLNLPKLDGLSVLKNIRKENKTVNIIILTARGSVDDKVNGLDLGANDYLTKPFHFAELDARVRSLLRRRTVQEDTVLCCGELAMDILSRAVTANGVPLSLTKEELDLLEYLILQRGCVVTLQDLLEHVWDGSVDEFSNSVRVHISSLRRKLKAVLSSDPIENMIGKGYLLKERKH